MGEPSSDMLGPNFGFGFNDVDFSDRLLRIEIEPDKLVPNQSIHAFHSSDSNCSVGTQVKNLHVNSLILAQKSPFFYKLFKNGMTESQRKDATLRINSSEKTALMDLLNFMYSNTLSATTSSDLIEVLIVADKFEVTSCMRYCIEFLMKIPTSLESTLPYFELPSTLQESEIVRPLMDASRQYLITHFRDFRMSTHEDAMKLPISALEVVLGDYRLQVDSEDDVFEFVLKWAHAHYPKLEERREIIIKRLIPLMSFPYMSCSKLKEILTRPDVDQNFDREEISKLVMDALFYKVEVLSDQHINASNDLGSTMITASGCLYHDRLFKVVQLQFPRRIMYYDLKKEECVNLLSSKYLYSESFFLGGRWFYLEAALLTDRKGSSEHFCLFVYLRKGSDQSCTLETEIAVMKKSSKLKVRIKAQKFTLQKNCRRSRCLFAIPRTNLMSDDSDYLADGILHLRVDLTTINSKA